MELLDQPPQGARPGRECADFDTAQLHRALPVPDDDHGVIECDLRRVHTIDAEGEGPAAGPYLQDRVERLPPGDGMHPTAHRAMRSQRGHL